MRKKIAASKYCPYTKDKDGHCIPCKACTLVASPDKQVDSDKIDDKILEARRANKLHKPKCTDCKLLPNHRCNKAKPDLKQEKCQEDGTTVSLCFHPCEV